MPCTPDNAWRRRTPCASSRRRSRSCDGARRGRTPRAAARRCWEHRCRRRSALPPPRAPPPCRRGPVPRRRSPRRASGGHRAPSAPRGAAGCRCGWSGCGPRCAALCVLLVRTLRQRKQDSSTQSFTKCTQSCTEKILDWRCAPGASHKRRSVPREAPFCLLCETLCAHCETLCRTVFLAAADSRQCILTRGKSDRAMLSREWTSLTATSSPAASSASPCAVHTRLGPGLLENAYEHCLCHEFDQNALAYVAAGRAAVEL